MSDPDVEAEVRSVIDRLTEALNTLDAQKLDSVLSDRAGSVYIGTDPAEWWSKSALSADLAAAMSVEGAQVRSSPDEVSVHVHGDVAWAEAKGTLSRNQGGERPIRSTWLFIGEAGSWRIAQAHYSIGIPNDELFNS